MWQREQPTEDGDWLWVCIWSCGCCHRDSGIAFVEDDEFHWNGNHPDGEVTAWMKIDLPPREWAEPWSDESNHTWTISNDPSDKPQSSS